MASADDQHDHGAADLCAASVWHKRLPRTDCFLPAARRCETSSPPARATIPTAGSLGSYPHVPGRDLISTEQDIREGKFQRQVAIVAGISALLSGFEAYYSHYKNNFRYKVQWSPVVLAPLLAAAAFLSVKKRRVATTALAGALRGCLRGCRHRLLLPCARRASPARRTQASALQHHVRAAHLCSAALRRRGHARHSGQLAAAQERMKSQPPMNPPETA